MPNPNLRPALVLGVLFGFIPLPVSAGVMGTTKGCTATQTGYWDPDFPKEVATTTTMDVQYITYSEFIAVGLSAPKWSAYTNYAFAGMGVAQGITPIDASDFTISNYIPWVVDEPDITLPSGDIMTGRVQDEDAGGAEIIVTYTPGASDPHNVNFIQAFTQSIYYDNRTVYHSSVIDGGWKTPYYNEDGYAGTGAALSNTVPLVTNPTAWMEDRSGDFEDGYRFGHIDGIRVTFQTFIEADRTIRDEKGQDQTYHVFYGGIQWGYYYRTVDIPEHHPGPEIHANIAASALTFLLASLAVMFSRKNVVGI